MYVCIQMCLQIPLFLIVTFLQQPAATTSMTQLAPRRPQIRFCDGMCQKCKRQESGCERPWYLPWEPTVLSFLGIITDILGVSNPIVFMGTWGPRVVTDRDDWCCWVIVMGDQWCVWVGVVAASW